MHLENSNMANYLTVRLTDDPSAVRFFQKLTLSLSFRAETERFSKIVGTFILSISNNSASVAAHIRRLIIDTALSVLQVWRFEQLLTTETRRKEVFQFCRYGVSSSYLPLDSLGGSSSLFCRYGVSSSYLPEPVLDSSLGEFCRYGVRAVIYL